MGGSDTRGAEALSGMRDWVNFAELKSQVKLAAVLRSYGVDWLRHSGPLQQYRGRCPIHQGHGPEAFHAHLGRGMFHCFACGAGGNVLDFVAAMEGCSVREAALRLQRSHGQGGRSPGVPARGLRRRELVTKKREVNPPLSFALEVDNRHPYLARRGLDPRTADHFGVGYYRARGLMQGRIAIPIHDDQGRLVAYCGRALDQDGPRYRFPAGFRKAQVLFNYHRAQATGEHRVIVVEGFFDCMRVHQAGYPCVVALMGARLSSAQQDLLADRFASVVLLLDGDQTGRTATVQIAGDLASACSVTQVLLPPDMQPDQMAAPDVRHALIGGEGGKRSAQIDRYDIQRPPPCSGGKSSAKQLRRDAYTKSLTNPPSETATTSEEVDRFLIKHTESDRLDDIQMGTSYLRVRPFVRPGGMGIIGFCRGGREALLFAARSREIDAVVAFHPAPIQKSEISRLTIPVQLHHGTDDHSVAVENSRRLEENLRAQKTPVELFLYEGADHGFLAYTRPFYRADDAKLAWKRATEFLQHELK